MKRILVLGDGGWGTALAILLDSNGHRVTLWSNFPDYAAYLSQHRENTKFLPGIKIPSSIKISSDIDLALPSGSLQGSRPTGKGIDLIVMAVPTQYARSVLIKFGGDASSQNFIIRKIPIVSVAKGIENKSLQSPSAIIKEVVGTSRICVLSGPSHAEEVARGLPASVVVASRNRNLAREVQRSFMNERFRVYTHNDVIGVEIGGALKNIIALAAGICDGLKLGDNAKSALLIRGMVEIARLGVALGAKKTTFFGLAGTGDLITTCISPYGRNRAVGLRIARGATLSEILQEMEKVAEGIWTTQSALKLARRCHIEMPITQEIYQVLFRGKKPLAALSNLMLRQPKSETEDL